MVDRSSRPDDDAVLDAFARLSTAVSIDPAPDALVAAVMTRVQVTDPPSVSRIAAATAAGADRLRRHWRRVTAVAVALLIGLLAVTPAGARIVEWFGFGGVQIVQEPSGAAPSETEPPDPAAAAGFTELSMAEAQARVSFPLAVPADLGSPNRVLIGPGDRVVSMVWTGGDRGGSDGEPASAGPVRLDQLAGQPDYGVVKQFYQDVQFATLDGRDAIWLRVPHPLVYLDPGGAEFAEPSRIAGPTLIWQRGPVTLRLEGVESLQRALMVAGSVG
jgi:hypothetical protein